VATSGFQGKLWRFALGYKPSVAARQTPPAFATARGGKFFSSIAYHRLVRASKECCFSPIESVA
jgi:hypothetical protein